MKVLFSSIHKKINSVIFSFLSHVTYISFKKISIKFLKFKNLVSINLRSAIKKFFSKYLRKKKKITFELYEFYFNLMK